VYKLLARHLFNVSRCNKLCFVHSIVVLSVLGCYRERITVHLDVLLWLSEQAVLLEL
jgi:hypothetical protein